MDLSPAVSMTPEGGFFDLPAANVSRYLWAGEHLTGRRVLDYGCGHGYGAHFLSEGLANFVLGIDSDSKAIKFAREHYKRQNLKFHAIEESEFRIPDSSFDAVVSFEVIEHLRNPKQYLARIRRLLTAQGEFFLSTPNKLWTEQFYKSGKPLNVFHVAEYYPTQLHEMFEDHFDTVGCFVRFTLGDYDQYRLEWSKHMSRCPIPIDVQRNSPGLVKHSIRAMYSRFVQLLGYPPPSELKGRHDLSRIESVKSPADILKNYPEQLWWLTKKRS